MMPHKNFVLFDFDGVIADSFSLAFDVARTFNPELDEAAYKRLFEGNVYESIKRLNGGRPVNSEEYFALFEPRFLKETRLVEGMPRVISDLSKSYVLSIISSTLSAPIQQFLELYNIAGHFSDVLGMDVHTSKVEKIRMVFAKYVTDADSCVFITDTLGDMHEAKEHGMGAIAVSWGFHSHETLEKGIPFRIVDRPDELPDAIADYFAGKSGI